MNTRSIINKKRLGRALNAYAEKMGVTRASLPTLKVCMAHLEPIAFEELHLFISPFNPERPKKKRVSAKQRENPELPLT